MDISERLELDFLTNRTITENERAKGRRSCLKIYCSSETREDPLQVTSKLKKVHYNPVYGMLNQIKANFIGRIHILC